MVTQLGVQASGMSHCTTSPSRLGPTFRVCSLKKLAQSCSRSHHSAILAAAAKGFGTKLPPVATKSKPPTPPLEGVGLHSQFKDPLALPTWLDQQYYDSALAAAEAVKSIQASPAMGKLLVAAQQQQLAHILANPVQVPGTDSVVYPVGVVYNQPHYCHLIKQVTDAVKPDAIAVESCHGLTGSYFNVAKVAEPILQKLFSSSPSSLADLCNRFTSQERLEWHEAFSRTKKSALKFPTKEEFFGFCVLHQLYCAENVACGYIAQQNSLWLQGLDYDMRSKGFYATADAELTLDNDVYFKMHTTALASSYTTDFKSYVERCKKLQGWVLNLMRLCFTTDQVEKFVQLQRAHADASNDEELKKFYRVVYDDRSKMFAEKLIDMSKGKVGPGPCKRIVAVMGQEHAVLLRQGLQQIV